MEVAVKTYQYLKFSNLSDLKFWDYYTLSIQNSIVSSYPIIELGNLIKQRKGFITITDGKEYKRCRVQISGNGVVLRDSVLGKEIKIKKQQLCKKDDFLVASIDAKVGGFGIVPQNLEGAIVSGHYFLFEIDTARLLPDFLGIIIKTKSFQKQVKSTGSTNYAAIRPYHVLGYKIPLPSLVEQEKVVKNYYSKINEAENLNQQEDDLENEIERYFLSELGIRKNMSSNFSRGFRIIEYKNLDRWDANVVSELTSIYQIEKIGSYVLKIATGTTPPTNRSEYFNGDINFYTPSDLGEIMYLNSASRKVSELALLDKKARRFEKGTILFVGIGSTVGKVGIVNNDYATSNQQITGFNIDIRFLLNEYVYLYFYYLRDITIKEQTKATLPIVNQNKIINIPIPIPPISKQQEIIKEISKMKNKKLVFETERRKLIIEAHQEFEQTIFR